MAFTWPSVPGATSCSTPLPNTLVFFAALFATASTSLLYMARHLTGYDLALMFGLLAVAIGSRRPSTAMSSVVTGVWAVATFLAYAGAWSVAAAACAIHVCDATSVRDGIHRIVLTMIGVVMPVGVMVAGYRWAGISWLDGCARSPERSSRETSQKDDGCRLSTSGMPSTRC